VGVAIHEAWQNKQTIAFNTMKAWRSVSGAWTDLGDDTLTHDDVHQPVLR
jgi:hypothetical protein